MAKGLTVKDVAIYVALLAVVLLPILCGIAIEKGALR